MECPGFSVRHMYFYSQARDIYEEAIHSVVTVRDFTQVFDVYSQFEESMIQAKMEVLGESGSSEEGKQALYV